MSANLVKRPQIAKGAKIPTTHGACDLSPQNALLKLHTLLPIITRFGVFRNIYHFIAISNRILFTRLRYAIDRPHSSPVGCVIPEALRSQIHPHPIVPHALMEWAQITHRPRFYNKCVILKTRHPSRNRRSVCDRWHNWRTRFSRPACSFPKSRFAAPNSSRVRIRPTRPLRRANEGSPPSYGAAGGTAFGVEISAPLLAPCSTKNLTTTGSRFSAA